MSMALHDDSDPKAEPIGHGLAAIGYEIASLAETGDRLQSMIGAALAADVARNADHMREFQAIDLLVQRLQGVSVFVDALTRQASPYWRVDLAEAAAGVPLSDLARRLTGQETLPPLGEAPRSDEGDFELF